MTSLAPRARRRRAPRSPAAALPDLYAQTTPRRKRLAPTSTRYWLSGYPALVAQWHPTKNGDLFPDVVRYGSERKVRWKCARGPDHEWCASVTNRVRGAGCPFCTNRYASVTNSLAALRPDVAVEWHPTRNTLRPEDVVVGSGRPAWWKCPKASDHVWQTLIVTRTTGGERGDGSGCPFCAGNRVARSNCLATVARAVAREWHPTKNGPLTPRDVTRGSTRRVWWRCRQGHEWQTAVMARGGSKGRGCPYCAGFLVTPTTSLAARYPDVARQWHPTKNGRTTPRDVKPFTHEPAWWRCPQGHEWQRSPARQMRHGTCPFCSGHRVGRGNSLRALHPKLARQWHPTKNGPRTPEDVTARSGARVWWRCPVNPRHVWETSVHSRTNTDPPSGCPQCWAKRRGQTRRVVAP